MASNDLNLLAELELYCHTFEELDLYILNYGLDINHPAAIERRRQLAANTLITDSDVYRLLKCCCNSLTELENIVVQHNIDWNDPSVQARRSDLQVMMVVIRFPGQLSICASTI